VRAAGSKLKVLAKNPQFQRAPEAANFFWSKETRLFGWRSELVTDTLFRPRVL